MSPVGLLVVCNSLGVSQAIRHRCCLSNLSSIYCICLCKCIRHLSLSDHATRNTSVMLQVVNGHSRKVTVGQKGQHRLPSLALQLTVDHNGNLFSYIFDHFAQSVGLDIKANSPQPRLHYLLYFFLILKALFLVDLFNFIPQSNTFWNMHWIEPR